MLYAHALHYICIFTMFHALDVCFYVGTLYAVRIGLGWAHDAIFVACHMLMHCSCIRTFSFHILVLYVDGDFLLDFPSHFILSLIDVYKDTVTHDKLIFPSAITRIICHSFVSYPESSHFSFMGALSAASVRLSEAQLQPPGREQNLGRPLFFWSRGCLGLFIAPTHFSRQQPL